MSNNLASKGAATSNMEPISFSRISNQFLSKKSLEMRRKLSEHCSGLRQAKNLVRNYVTAHTRGIADSRGYLEKLGLELLTLLLLNLMTNNRKQSG